MARKIYEKERAEEVQRKKEKQKLELEKRKIDIIKKKELKEKTFNKAAADLREQRMLDAADIHEKRK